MENIKKNMINYIKKEKDNLDDYLLSIIYLLISDSLAKFGDERKRDIKFLEESVRLKNPVSIFKATILQMIKYNKEKESKEKDKKRQKRLEI